MLATPFFRTCRLKHAKHISAGDIEPDENRKRTSQTGPTLYISRVLAHSGWCRASHQIEDINVFPLKFGTNGETTWKIAKYCPVLFWRWPETTQVKDVPATPFPIIYTLIFQCTLVEGLNPYKRLFTKKKDPYLQEKKTLICKKKTLIWKKKDPYFWSYINSIFDFFGANIISK